MLSSLRSRRTAPRCALALALAGSAGLAAAGAMAAAPTFVASHALPGLHGGRAWSVAVDPGDPHILLAATDNGVYRSADSGDTWTQAGLDGRRVWTVGFDLRGTHPAFAGLAGQGVVRSDDAGLTWNDASAGLSNLTVRVLAFGLAGVAAATSNGVSVSPDGATWHDAGLRGLDISALAVSANTPRFTLVAGADGGALGQGFLFRNSGAGGGWEVLQQGLPQSAVVSSVVAGPLPQTVPNRPLVVTTNKGTFHSGDGGTTWTGSAGIPDQPVPETLTSAAFSPADPNLVYSGSDAGGSSGGDMLRSTDSGASFGPASSGLPENRRNVSAVTVIPTAPPVVVAVLDPPGGGAQIFRETDDTAPPPAAIAAENNPAAPATAPPAPPVRAVTRPTTPGVAEQSSPAAVRALRRAVDWPFPLAVELLAIVVVAYAAVRWRQRYLDVEGPP